MRPFVKTALLATAATLALSACTMAPKYERGVLPVPDRFPAAATTGASAETLPWRQVFLDPRLQAVIDQALANNTDLRVAVLNVDKARAQYRIQRASLFPAVNGAVSGYRGNTNAVDASGNPATSESFSATLGASWEFDLFGRVRSLNAAALQSYFAVDENRKAARISLISAVASAWLNLGADQDQLRLSRETLRLREDSLSLTQRRFDLGSSDQMTLRQAQVLTEQARVDVANLTASVQQDQNALRLLAGAEVAPQNLPDALPDAAILGDLPVGLPSDVLLKRPDVMAAEFGLKSANANIGAARASFFPSISLTGNVGKASGDLDHLFDGADVWSFTPSISLPIFAGGANLANLKASQASRDIAVAQYQGAIQSAFRDIADQLATRATIDDQLDAQTRAVAAAADSYSLAQARFNSGVDSRLTLTDSERTLYGAQQALIGIRLVRALNLANLYAALGGGLS